MMLSKSQKKLIASMGQKKYRDLHGLFLAEGNKTVNEFISAGIVPHLLIVSDDWLPDNPELVPDNLIQVSRNELSSVSFQKTPKGVLALFPQFKYHLNNSAIQNKTVLILDGIQDPGNLGTIIRIADWFGIDQIVCSTDTADVYNPKVVQATMGAAVRVPVHYTDLPEFIVRYKNETQNPVYGTYPGFDNLYHSELSEGCLIIIGNEGNGIRPEVDQLVTERVTIPSYPGGGKTSESLNAGVATAIICSEFRRRLFMSNP
ncbi:RNA methyltransferase, TrmH family [Alkalitalea saponilacus]|uniref:RNA methyltransferase, TrmH family n=2 Tax=Alkalitalea saponilacus TaxID=889453 RepID=A0A1T5C900_9BACT|nr:RNA methyltransferase [Alkalitalea saponilacus]SKB55928.1 RNA methyltransferase, TrmH family [Alkalitalea saponilacus]